MSDSLLRDLDRERSKMQADVEKFNRHYEDLVEYVRQHVEQTTIEWAKLVANHSKAILLIIETTHVVDENDYTYGDSEPIRFTTLSLADGEIWDQLLHPEHSKAVRGSEYHGLTMDDLKDKPRIADVWTDIEKMSEDCHIIVFNADHALSALRNIRRTHLLDGAYCLHNKSKEYYGQFYELSLETILSYQGIDKKREDLKDSRERILMLAQVVRNIAAGMKKKEQEPEVDENSLDEHPF
jgi:DNA polymerase III epsilon subunit-like protein